MVTQWAKRPDCFDCGKKKGPKQAHLKRCFACQRVFNKKAGEASHGSRIMLAYGIGKEDYLAILAYQAGRCAICQRATGSSKRLAVDHNHACKAGHAAKFGCPECVRGLLCSVCNTFIGRMRDDPRVGERMASYLREPPYQALRAGRGPAILVRRVRESAEAQRAGVDGEGSGAA